MSADRIKQLMTENAATLRHLNQRINETFARRGEGQKQFDAWSDACAEFHYRYDDLAFPGGYATAIASLEASDPGTIDVALCFVELRPYFFRSGYMYTLLMRRLKKCALSPEQAARYAAVVARAAAWRQQKRADLHPSR